MDEYNEDWESLSIEIDKICEKKNIKISLRSKADILVSFDFLKKIGIDTTDKLDEIITMLFLQEKYKSSRILYPFIFIN
jgi:hypothetical protein